MNGILSFLKSKMFLKNLIMIFVIFSILIWIVFKSLDLYTLHGETVEVPDLKRKTLIQVDMEFQKLGLKFEVRDSTKYNPLFPRLSVMEQDPKVGNLVKEGRTIYLSVNPTNFKTISMPNVIQLTLRNAKAILLAAGLQIGHVSYVRDIGKDMVLDVKYNGKRIKAGHKIQETSYIDLVCGDGQK